MKSMFRILISTLLCMMCMAIAIAQDDGRFPPLDHEGERGMIQALSNGDPRQLAWSSDSQDLVVSAIGGTWVYDINQPEAGGYHLKESKLTHHVAFAPHHDIYLSYSPIDYCPYGHCEDAQQVFVRDANTHEVLHQIRGMTNIHIQFSHDGELVAVSSRYYGIVIWRTDSFRKNIGKDPATFYQCQVKTPAEAGRALFSRDDKLVSYVGWRSSPMMSPGDYSVWFWDTQTCDVYFRVEIFPEDYQSYPPPIVSMSLYNPNGPLAIIQDFENDGKLHIWDVTARQDLGTVPDGFSDLWGFTPDNQHLLFYDKSTKLAKIWHIANRTTTRTFFADDLFAFDDTSLLMLRTGKLYRITETTETLLLDAEQAIINIKPTDDKQWLFVYYADKSMALWDIATQTVIGAWEKPIGDKISPDKSKIAWIGNDHKVYIWDLTEQRQWQLNYISYVGGNILWSETDNTMLTYTRSADSPSPLPDVQYIDHTSMFHVWTLTDTGFERRWSREGLSTIIGLDDAVMITLEDDLLIFWDVLTGDMVHRTALSTCQTSIQTDPFCARWADIRAYQHPPPSAITPVVVRAGDQFIIENPNHPNERISYTLPGHIVSRMNNNNSIEWRITPNGDLLVRIGTVVYNITQDTAMQMGDTRGPWRSCRENCRSFGISRLWLSRDGSILFGHGMQEGYPFTVTQDSVLTAWDTRTGRNLYTLYGDLDDRITLSTDEQFVFRFGNETYVGMGKTYYNRHAIVYDAKTGELLLYADTYDDNATDIHVSPHRRFVVVDSDNSRVWAIVAP